MKLLSTKPNVQAPDATWPFGKSTDNTGSNNGLPLNSDTLEDYHQFFAKLFDESGLTANGLLDNATNGFQLWDALRVLIPVRTKIIPIGDWDMDVDPTVSIAHGLPAAEKIRDCSVIIMDDTNVFGAFLGKSDEGAIGLIDATNIALNRLNGGFFDSPAFSTTPFNRGFITIQYVD
ncbi:MAG: hypothetical protein JKY43_04575 [Phycisphaerales bacterium]|nr:hypothetical protein [Phycisphaerales bacterium]